ncbi:MAG: hypothetical protein WCR72_12130 [Bacteroidota bacterium]
MNHKHKKTHLQEETDLDEETEETELAGSNEKDDINTFIRKTQLQALVLKKLTESLSQPELKETGEVSPPKNK